MTNKEFKAMAKKAQITGRVTFLLLITGIFGGFILEEMWLTITCGTIFMIVWFPYYFIVMVQIDYEKRRRGY